MTQPANKCPICKRETLPEHRPFCSKRCADVDLGKWLSGAYAIPSDDPEDAEDILRGIADHDRPH